MRPFWRKISGIELAQGDFLRDCLVPVFEPDYGNQDPGGVADVPVSAANLIVVTQTCDLQNRKVTLAALCPIHTLPEFESANASFAKKGRWEEVRKGRIEGLHLLASPESPEDNLKALIVDFGQIYSLPLKYLEQHAEKLGDRWRLDHPFLEHFSQAFARYFMRVGLPSTIPPY